MCFFECSKNTSRCIILSFLSFFCYNVIDDDVTLAFRSADCHCGFQDPSCCSARSALPGALHPAASAHYGLPEGTLTVTYLQDMKVQLSFAEFSNLLKLYKCKEKLNRCKKEM